MSDGDRELLGNLFEDLFGEELRADDLRLLRHALTTRLGQLRAAHARGEATAEQVAELEQAAEKLTALREEEIIAAFVEEGVETTIRRQRLLDLLE